MLGFALLRLPGVLNLFTALVGCLKISYFLRDVVSRVEVVKVEYRWSVDLADVLVHVHVLLVRCLEALIVFGATH